MNRICYGTAETLRDLMDAADCVVFFTGAGISTESGIPDFRSPGTGLWSRMKPIEFQDFIASEEVRQAYWSRRFEGEQVLENAKPNEGHRVIARLVQIGKVHSVITQNVDNLHRVSGIPDGHLIELHGNAHYARCLRCERRYEINDLKAQFRKHRRVAPCQSCGGIIKTATISFGQPMPPQEMERAQAAIERCDLCVVAGSSLAVYPAAGFPELAKRRGAKLAIINREGTPLDRLADCVIRGELGATLGIAATRMTH
jgi:NAD-dependent deacetylase